MEIKNWIRQLRPELKDDSIIIRKTIDKQNVKTQIVILNNICCQSEMIIPKKPSEVKAEDIFELKSLINHTHN